MCLLHRRECLLAGKVSAQKLCSLLVSQRVHEACGVAVLVQQSFGFLNQSTFEHSFSTLVDSLVEGRAFGIEPNPQNPKTLKRISPLLP